MQTTQNTAKIKLAWFSRFLRHSAMGNEVGLFYNAPEPTRGTRLPL